MDAAKGLGYSRTRKERSVETVIAGMGRGLMLDRHLLPISIIPDMSDKEKEWKKTYKADEEHLRIIKSFIYQQVMEAVSSTLHQSLDEFAEVMYCTRVEKRLERSMPALSCRSTILWVARKLRVRGSPSGDQTPSVQSLSSAIALCVNTAWMLRLCNPIPSVGIVVEKLILSLAFSPAIGTSIAS